MAVIVKQNPAQEETFAESQAKFFEVDDIMDWYRRGQITAGQKNDLLRAKARSNTANLLKDNGYTGAVFKAYVEEIQKGLDNATLQMGILADGSDGSLESLDRGFVENALLSMWGMAQIFFAPKTALENVNRELAENTALEHGASPGTAWFIGIAAALGTGFAVDVSAARSFAKGVQVLGKAARQADRFKKAAPTIKEFTETVSEGVIKSKFPITFGGTSEEAELAKKVVGEALQRNGADPTILKKVGVPIKKLSEEVIEQLAKARDKGPAEEFLDDVAKFRNKLAKTTKPKKLQTMLEEAREKGIDIEAVRALQPGKKVSDIDVAAYLQAMKPMQDRVKTVIDLALESRSSRDLENATSAVNELLTLLPQIRGLQVEVGRATTISREFTGVKGVSDFLEAMDLETMARGDIAGAQITALEDIREILKQPEAATQFVINTQKGFLEEGKEYYNLLKQSYTHLLLLGPSSGVKTFFGNLTFALNHTLETQLAGYLSLDQANGAIKNGGIDFLEGMVYALRPAMKSFGEAFDPNAVSLKTRFDTDITPFKGPIGRLFTSGTNFVDGNDRFFKTILTMGSHFVEAKRLAVQRGLEGDALAEEVTRLIYNPTMSMLRTAKDLAEKGTMQTSLGNIGQKSKDILQFGPAFFYNPFFTTKVNQIKFAWDRTPGLQLLSGQLYDDIIGGGAKADMATARLALSSMTGHFVYYLAQAGLITGPGPVDPGLRKTWRATHEPFSAITPGGWVPYKAIDPLNTQIGLIASFAEINNQLDDPTAEQLSTSIVLSGVSSFLEGGPFVQANRLGDIFATLQSGGSVSEKSFKLLRQPLVIAGTGGPFGQAIKKQIDPIPREATGLFAEIQSKIPGYSLDFPPITDGYGNPVMPPQALGPKWLNLLNPILKIRPFTTDKVAIEGSKLGIRAPYLSRTLGGRQENDFDVRSQRLGGRVPVNLDDKQFGRRKEIYNELVYSKKDGIVTTLLNDPSYKRLTQAAQIEEFEHALSERWLDSKDFLLEEDSELEQRVFDAEDKQELPFMTPQEQDQAAGRREIPLTFDDILQDLSPEEAQNFSEAGGLEQD